MKCKKSCAIHSNSCDVHLYPPSHPPYHQQKRLPPCVTKRRDKKHSAPSCNSWMKDGKIVLGVIFLCLSVLVSINLKRLMSQVNHRATVSILGWFSLLKVFNPIFYAVHCASDYKKCTPFPPNHSCKEAPWCFEESPLEYTSWQCERRISCYSSAQ